MRAVVPLSVAAAAAAAFSAPAHANLYRNCVYGSFVHQGDLHAGVVYGGFVVYDPLATGATYTCTFETASGTVLWTGSAGTGTNAAVLVAPVEYTTSEGSQVCTTYSWNDASGPHSGSLGCQPVF